MGHFRLLLVLGAAIVLAGCGNLNSIYRPLDIDSGTGALVGIKQRAILVTHHDDEGGKDNHSKRSIIVCAEPYPDALSAYAASLSGGDETVKASAAFQESSAYVGLRTSSIQLLRDAMYRVCEGRMNGAISDAGYALLLRRYQREIVALLAIEQLTGALRAPTVAVRGTIPRASDSDPGGGSDGPHSTSQDGQPSVESSTIIDYKGLETVANTVKYIADKILDVQDMDAFCLARKANGDIDKDTIKGVCQAYLDHLKQAYTKIAACDEEIAHFVKNKDFQSIEKLKSIGCASNNDPKIQRNSGPKK